MILTSWEIPFEYRLITCLSKFIKIIKTAKIIKNELLKLLKGSSNTAGATTFI